MNKAKRFLNERIVDTETNTIGLVVQVKEENGQEMVGYVSANSKTGDPEINWQVVEKIVLLLPAVWEVIRTIVSDIIAWFGGKKKAAETLKKKV